MKQVILAVAALGSFAIATVTVVPKQQVRACSSTEWMWDTFVQDLGCSFLN